MYQLTCTATECQHSQYYIGHTTTMTPMTTQDHNWPFLASACNAHKLTIKTKHRMDLILAKALFMKARTPSPNSKRKGEACGMKVRILKYVTIHRFETKWPFLCVVLQFCLYVYHNCRQYGSPPYRRPISKPPQLLSKHCWLMLTNIILFFLLNSDFICWNFLSCLQLWYSED